MQYAVYAIFIAVTLAVGAAAALQLDKLPRQAPGVFVVPEIPALRSLPQLTLGARLHTLRFHAQMSADMQRLVAEINRGQTTKAIDARSALRETVLLCHMTPQYEFLVRMVGSDKPVVVIVPALGEGGFACQMRFEEPRMRKALGDNIRLNTGVVTVEPAGISEKDSHGVVMFLSDLDYNHEDATEALMNAGDKDVAVLALHANSCSR